MKENIITDEEEKFRYFISYSTSDGIFNGEIYRTEILNIDSIREIESGLQKELDTTYVNIINYRMF